jgi:hypothetical protein
MTATAPDGLIELRLQSLEQLFDPFDPFPLPTRDLAESAEDFVVGTPDPYSEGRGGRGEDQRVAICNHNALSLSRSQNPRRHAGTAGHRATVPFHRLGCTRGVYGHPAFPPRRDAKQPNRRLSFRRGRYRRVGRELETNRTAPVRMVAACAQAPPVSAPGCSAGGRCLVSAGFS